jgi:hypothetical protein
MEPRNSTKTSSGLFLATSGLVLYSRGTDNAENTLLQLRSADHTENTSHMLSKHCWDVSSLRLRGSVFTEPMPISRLQKPYVPFLRACITYKRLFLWLNHSFMKQIRHNVMCSLYILSSLGSVVRRQGLALSIESNRVGFYLRAESDYSRKLCL